jgi:hypothetical protein
MRGASFAARRVAALEDEVKLFLTLKNILILKSRPFVTPPAAARQDKRGRPEGGTTPGPRLQA